MGHRMHHEVHHEKQEHPTAGLHDLPHITRIMAGRLQACKVRQATSELKYQKLVSLAGKAVSSAQALILNKLKAEAMTGNGAEPPPSMVLSEPEA
jgi:hypothetical protein